MGLHGNLFIPQALQIPTDRRIYVLAAALKAGYSIEKLYKLTKIDHWFLHKFRNIIDCANTLEGDGRVNLKQEYILRAKKLGFSDLQIAKCIQR